MLLKILLVVLVVALVYYIFFKSKKSVENDDKKLQSNDMVECTTCGTYIDVDDATLSNGKYYCSKECLKNAHNRA